MHASLNFAFEFPNEFKEWHRTSNSIVVLAAKDEPELKSLYSKLVSLGSSTSFFEEPDIGNEWTSICVEPHPDNKRLLRSYPLAGKQ